MKSWGWVIKIIFLVCVNITILLRYAEAVYGAGEWLWRSHSLGMGDTAEVFTYAFLLVLAWRWLARSLRGERNVEDSNLCSLR